EGDSFWEFHFTDDGVALFGLSVRKETRSTTGQTALTLFDASNGQRYYSFVRDRAFANNKEQVNILDGFIRKLAISPIGLKATVFGVNSGISILNFESTKRLSHTEFDMAPSGACANGVRTYFAFDGVQRYAVHPLFTDVEICDGTTGKALAAL